MSKTIAGILVVGVVVVGGYFIFKGKTPESTAVTKGEQTEAKPAETGKKMAFSEFVKQGGSYKCDVKQAMSDIQNSGTVYMSGGKMRGEFSTIAEGRPMQTSFIFRDGYSYTWSSMMPSMGFKMKVATDTASTSGDASGTYSWNAKQIGDYNCVAWTGDETKFTVPTSVTFRDMSGK